MSSSLEIRTGLDSSRNRNRKNASTTTMYPMTRGELFESAASPNVFLRHEDEIGAMGKRDRFKAKLRNLGRRILCQFDRRDDGMDLEEGSTRQYRVEATRKKRGFLRRLCCRRDRTHYNIGMTVSRYKMSLVTFLHWMFRVNFFFLFSLFCVLFFAMTIVFAGLITAAGKLDNDCVRVGGKPFESAGAAFADAFALSWTTFSTVGYGSTYPALGHENENSTNCLLITAICSLESFIGVLYSGFCGAILFGKILRIQSHAQVIFSDPIVIRYGSGVDSQPDNDNVYDDLSEKNNDEPRKQQIPCPVLEFRIVNRLFNEVGGEIIDATLNAVASIDADDNEAPGTRDSSSLNRGFDTVSSTGSKSYDDVDQNRVHESSPVGSESRSDNRFLDKLRNNAQNPDDESVTRQINKRIFSKMVLEASEHPFFKRVWLARHILNERSPLLTQKVRKAIRRCGGYWPESYNSYEGVHESLAFGQILVSLNGVSNVSASDVYAQKIYDFVDVNVGYQFVNLLYRDNGVLKVDSDLINDVKEQNGGGGEPLT
eukprot:CAMPEP_0194202110 /NCGR_PEP_ID=MMETSP0156-20130528/2215_1 /TAXON_ID=33649 /ORGANISM="Thalassionema nitzschioides, Strain L26-B" /LENGTH=541 /DNA_ID=CAMNT_0038927503 /DNA_START=23 /DNA_END=1644 /DNA_ORIENTATION=-